jgi:voltage-gated potassium channel Kch
VGVTDRPGVPSANLLVQLYYASGLFLLGGMDLGTPIDGAPGARVLLWAAYIIAPLITTTAVVEGALWLAGSGLFHRLGLRGHVVVVGLGNLGTSFVAALHELQADRLVVGVDRKVDTARAAHLRRRYGIRAFAGDAYVRGALDSLALDRAHAVALLTDDDLLNLEVAFRITSKHPSLLVVAHVSDLGLERALSEVRESRVGGRVQVFNAHRMAAEHLYERHLPALFEGTAAKDAVVVAGFGRFGQTIVEFLERQAKGELAHLVAVDTEAAARVRTFREQVPCSMPCRLCPIDGDLSDPRTWVAVAEEVGPEAVSPVVVVGCDDDRINLRVAMQVRSRWPEANIFVRCQNESAFTEELSRRHDFTVLAVDAVLLTALRDAQRAWVL